jgi:hypothetical protein
MKQAKVSQVNLCRGVLVILTVCAVLVWWIFSRPAARPKVITYENVVNTIKVDHIIPNQFADYSIKNVKTEQIQSIKTIYVIPGGGSTSDDGYPEWTKRRIVAAHDHYKVNSNQGKAVFFTLSAGSLNSPNLLLNDGRVMFECQHMIQHLVNIGVPSDAVFGDMFSWDSVTNGYSLRMFIDGILLYRDMLIAESLSANQPQNVQIKEKESKLIEKLQVEVFISDFHADRIKESFLFLLNLVPAMTDRVQLNINIVDSQGIKWKSAEEFNQRIKHEEIATEKLRETKKQITTVQQYHAFIMLGGHQGLYKYLHGAYVKSQGVGW